MRRDMPHSSSEAACQGGETGLRSTTMSGTGPTSTQLGGSFERARWEAECAFREREVAVREREQRSKEAQLALAKAQHGASRWKNPLVVAILAAAVAAIGNAFVAYTNADSQTKLEAQKSEQARILEMIKTGSPDAAAENLGFLLDAGLIKDPGIRRDLRAFLDRRKPGGGPSLPTVGAATKLVSQFEGARLSAYKDAAGVWTIGLGHTLTAQELRTGKLVVAGQQVNFREGITKTQADRLLDNDLQPYRKRILRLVKVKLSSHQLAALTSFVFNVGIGALKLRLLPKLNTGQYDEVPREMLKWDKLGEVAVPALRRRREAEVRLWNTP
jgi:GH24 family phage-related lysozyme (muramidase)